MSRPTSSSLPSIGVLILKESIDCGDPSVNGCEDEASAFYSSFLSSFSLSSEPLNLLRRPWSLISHMFLHEGIWHIGWNMLMLYWFGRIVGDLIGDSKILPIYFLGGLCGALFYLTYAYIVTLIQNFSLRHHVRDL